MKTTYTAFNGELTRKSEKAFTHAWRFYVVFHGNGRKFIESGFAISKQHALDTASKKRRVFTNDDRYTAGNIEIDEVTVAD